MNTTIESTYQHIQPINDIVIVCFGTMSIVGDSLGPRVGTLLKSYNLPFFVYGDEECTINGKNMEEWIHFIREVHKGATIISIDASLGRKDKIGDIVIRKDGVCPAAVKGKNSRFGDIGILTVVGENSSAPVMALMTQSIDYMCELARKTANCVIGAL